MSRIGRQIITVPDKVEITLVDGVISVKGPLGTLTRPFPAELELVTGEKEISVKPKKEGIESSAIWGTYASHLNNMVTGVTAGFTKKLIIEGVGFKMTLKGENLELEIGFSHPVLLPIPAGIKALVEKNVLTISGFDKEAVGEFSARIRSHKKTEPYKGKGIRYEGEFVRRKQGKKTAA